MFILDDFLMAMAAAAMAAPEVAAGTAAAGAAGAGAAGAAGATGAGLLGAGATGAGMTAAELAAMESAQVPGLLSSQMPQGFANTLEAGIGTGNLDTGYTPSSLWQAFKNASPENNTSLPQNLMNYGRQGIESISNGSTFNRMAANMEDPKKRFWMHTGLGLMKGAPQQQMQPVRSPTPPAVRAQSFAEVKAQNRGLMGQGMDETERRRRLMLGLLGGGRNGVR